MDIANCKRYPTLSQKTREEPALSAVEGVGQPQVEFGPKRRVGQPPSHLLIQTNKSIKL
jgi:hypothetical protein